MSEKIADDYGFEKLAAYLAAYAYTGGDGGTFAVATDADMDALFTTGETSDWQDKYTVKGTIARKFAAAWPTNGICNYCHVPGNSIIFEHMMNMEDANIGINGPVSMESSSCNISYFLDIMNKRIFAEQGYANVIDACVARVKKLYAENQARLNEHIAEYKATSKDACITDEDVRYALHVERFLGKNGSTESSWTYIYTADEYTYERATDISSKLENAVCIDSKTKARAEEIKNLSSQYNNYDGIKILCLYPYLKHIDYYLRLFGTIESYAAYLAGGAS